ncbi:MAG: PAS domain-containing protein [Spirochaetales bacterium]|nr:PAS domain-containing protein [Spirochaetales bacterium]
MKLLSLVYFLTFTVYLWLAFFVLFRNPKAKLNRICALLIFTFALWAAGQIFIAGSSTFVEARLSDNIGSLGWCSFPSISLWFALVLTGRKKVLKKWFIYLLIFSIPLVFIYKQWNGDLTSDYLKTPYGWISVWADTFWKYLFYAYYISFVILFLFIILSYRKKTKISYEKKQVIIIFITTLISLITGSITDALLPELGYTIPSFTPFILLIWGGGIVYAITKYKLMTVTVAFASAEIIATMPDTLFLILPDTIIVDINNATCELTEYSKKELIGKPVEVLLSEETPLFKGAELEDFLKKGTIRDYSMNYRTKSGKRIPVSFSGSVIRDNERNVIGIVGIGRDMREMLRMQQRENEVSAEKARIKALEEARTGLEKMVEERTAELKKSYNVLSEKTKILERFQKITVGRELEMIKLKAENNTLLEELGKPKKYKLPESIKEEL